MVGINLALIVFSPFLCFVPLFFLFFYLVHTEQMEYKNFWIKGLFLLFLWSVLVGIINMQLVSCLAGLAFLGYLGLSIYIHNYCHTDTCAEKLFFSLFLLTVGSSFLGILEKANIITYHPSWWKYLFGLCTLIKNEENLLRITGTFGNSNFAATWYAVLILVGFYFFERAGGRKRALLAAGVIMLAVALVMTESRGALIGLFLGIIVYDFMSGQKSKMYIRLCILLVLMLNFSEWLPRGDVLYPSIDLRQAIWQNCFNMFLKKPVTGWGIMGIYFADGNVYQYLRVLHAHNTLLSVATMLGTVGVVIFAAMEWCVLRGIKTLHFYRCPLTPLLGGIQAVFIGHGIFDFTIMGTQVGILFVGCSAVVGALASSYTDNKAQVVIGQNAQPAQQYKG
jgi:putative inorganic carbon (HCO3(-)) transporter